MKYESVITLPEIKSRLKGKSEKQFIQMIAGCYKLSDEVKYYLSTQLIGNEMECQRMINELREKLRTSFWSYRGGAPNIPDLKQARKIIANLKKITKDPEIVISFMLDYIDHGISFSCEYGDMSGAYYGSIESMFGSMVKLIENNCNEIDVPAVIIRIELVVEKSNKFGWGVHENLSDWKDEMIENIRTKHHDIDIR